VYPPSLVSGNIQVHGRRDYIIPVRDIIPARDTLPVSFRERCPEGVQVSKGYKSLAKVDKMSEMIILIMPLPARRWPVWWKHAAVFLRMFGNTFLGPPVWSTREAAVSARDKVAAGLQCRPDRDCLYFLRYANLTTCHPRRGHGAPRATRREPDRHLAGSSIMPSAKPPNNWNDITVPGGWAETDDSAWSRRKR